MGSARRSSTSDIDRAGQILLPGNFYRGAFAAGQEPPPDGTQHVVIINTMDRPPGEYTIVPLGHNIATFKLPYPGTKDCPRAYPGMP